MGEFIAAIAIFSLAILGMSLGAMLTGRQLSGSCGGSDLCDFCDDDTKKKKNCTHESTQLILPVE